MERRHRTGRIAALTGAVAGLIVTALGVLPATPAGAAVVDPYRVTTPVAATAGATGPIAVSPDGTLLAVAEGSSVELIRTADETHPVTLTPASAAPVESIDFASSATLVIGTDTAVEFVSWTAGAGGVLTPTTDRQVALGSPAASAVSVVAVSETTAYALDQDGTIWLADVSATAPAGGSATPLLLDQDSYRAIAYSAATGQLYAITDSLVEAISTTVTAGGVLRTLTLNATAQSLALSPDGQHLFIGENGQLAELAVGSWVQPTTTTLPSPVSLAYPPVPSSWNPAGTWTMSQQTLSGSTNTDAVSCNALTVSTDGSTVYCTGTTASAPSSHDLFWFKANGATLGFGGVYDGTAGYGTQAIASAPGTTTTVLAATGGRAYAALADGSVASIPVGSVLAAAAVPNGSTPAAPQSVVVASNTSTTIDVSWSAPASTGGQPILGYLVAATPAGGGAASYCMPGGTGTACTITDLTPTTAYAITVTAANILGPGSPSDPQSVIPGVPARPRTVTLGLPALSGSTVSLPVTWTAPVSSGTSALTGYLVCADLVATTGAQTTCGSPTLPLSSTRTCPVTQTLIRCASASTTTATLTGLDPKATYLVTITAYNATSSGTTSAPLSIAPGAPSVPNNLKATTQSQTITLTWTPPSFAGITTTGTGGSIVTTNATVTYTAMLEPGDIACVGSKTAPMSATSCTWTGLTNGVSYSAQVNAYAGASNTSSGSSTTTSGRVSPAATLTNLVPATVPGRPSVTDVTTAPGSATVTWIAPTDDGGMPITGFTATARTGGALRSCTSAATEPSCTIEGLTNGVTYGVTVTATNAKGVGLASQSYQATPSGPPTAVPNVRIAVNGTQVTVQWDQPAVIGAAALTGYTVVATAAGETRRCTSQSITSCRLTGLRSGVTYAVVVVARNSGGFQSAASAPARVTLLATPARPTVTLKRRPKHKAAVTVRWTPVAGATGYLVSRTGGPLLGVKRTVSGSATSLTFPKLPRGRYKFTVTALGAGGRSSASAAVGARVK